MNQLIALSIALLASACVTAPEGGTRLPSRSLPVTFTGFADTPGETLTLTVLNHRTGEFEEFARTVAGETEQFSEDQFGNHPALYPWSIQTPIAVTEQELNDRFDLRGCPTVITPSGETESGESTSTSTQAACLLSFEAQIVVREDIGTLWVFQEGGVNCVSRRINSGDDLLVASRECSPDGGEPLRLIALE